MLQQIYVRIYPSLPDSLPMMTLARFAIAFALLIVPTALMGATLPLVIKSSVVRTTRLGERMALLYGMNTTGAIVGALAAGLYLIPDRGIHGTFLVAASAERAHRPVRARARQRGDRAAGAASDADLDGRGSCRRAGSRRWTRAAAA